MKHRIALLFFFLILSGSYSGLFAQSNTYTPPKPDTVKIRFVSNEANGVAWILKPKPDWAKYTRTQKSDGQASAPNTPEPEWKKFLPKDPVCETTPAPQEGGDKIDVWTVEGWAPVEFDFTASDGEFPITTKFTVFPNNKEVRLESNGSIGSLWTLKTSQGVTPTEKPVVSKNKKKDKKKQRIDEPNTDQPSEKPEKEENLVGQPQVVSWSLADMTEPTATADFVFNYRGKEITTVTLTIIKKPEPAAEIPAENVQP